MDRLEALVALNMVSDIGSVRLQRLLDSFETPGKIFSASREELISVSGISEASAGRICSFKTAQISKELALIKKNNLKVLTLEDDDYPQILKNIPSPPIVLYIKGCFTSQDDLALGIVGSRQASFYGLNCAEKFAHDLAGMGVVVVSGMARGIDTCAHRAALRNKGRTIAVMGSGFGDIYPSENKKLSEDISQSGAVISEFSFNTPPKRENFPRRNRIISGLSLGVLVVEAAKNSGALITADFALEQGREVFAIPGKVDSPNSSGTNELIKQGAKLASSANDIIDELKIQIVSNIKIQESNESVHGNILTKEQVEFYKLFSEKPISWDELIVKTNMQIPGISKMVLELETKKFIRQLPGKQLIRN